MSADSPPAPLPARLQEIVEDFAGMDRGQKIETLIAYAESLPALPERYREERSRMEPVPECMTPVFLAAEWMEAGGIIFHFDIPPHSPTVRGLAALLAAGLNGSTAGQILAVPADFYLPMNLQEAVTGQRINGFLAVLARMKQAVLKLLETG